MKSNQMILASFQRFMTGTEELLPRNGYTTESKNISVELITDENGYMRIKENL
jgi:hypothetical protein